MDRGSVHRELNLADPIQKGKQPLAPRIPLTLALPHASWLEIHRRADDTIRYHLGAEGPTELAHTYHCLAEAFPGLELGAATLCPLPSLETNDVQLVRAIPTQRHHYWPMTLLKNADRAGLLLHSLSANELHGNELVLQILFRRVPQWESGFLSGSYERFVVNKVQSHAQDRNLLSTLHARKSEPAYHIEIRAVVTGPSPQLLNNPLLGWLGSWTSFRGNPWWSLWPAEGSTRARFVEAFLNHDMLEFAAKKGRRDLSASELAQVLPIPWRESHHGLAYAGAPTLAPPRELVYRTGDPVSFGGIVVGCSGGESVCLPADWHHLAILGKTRSGKSTLALNVAGQILAYRPQARVVILEPTGALIDGLVERITRRIAHDTIKVDPGHPTFERDGEELVTVPMNLLHLVDRRGLGAAEYERKTERLLGDLFQSIKNAWGEASIGGRAEFVLGAVIQGLLGMEGTNLVDAYSVLSDKKVLQRLERLASGTQLRSALRVHLPKLDYSITISSVDKVGKIATNPLLRKSLCQRYRPVPFDRLLDHRLVLLDLGKGALGTEASTFLGAIFLTKLWSAIQERDPKEGPIYLVVDEFHNFAIPAFADMLSEGARLGLHVVAITQYLNHIPEKIRSALVGNVDAWMFFSIGPEDMREAHDLVQGSRFGWQPEHLVGGLGPHQAALSLRNALLKLHTHDAPPCSVHADENREVVRESSRRYARLEDSETSPLSLSSRQVATFLDAFTLEEGRTRSQLSVALGWPLAEVNAATALCVGTGDVAEGQGRNGIEIGLRARGVFHREAMAAARNEGEEHCSLLADAAAFLRHRGVHVRIVPQEGGYLRPDAEFGWQGRDYSLEVECSTLVKHHEQVARNLQKALAKGRRCLIVVPDEEMAHVFESVLRREVPGAELWRQVGLLWRTGIEEMVPYRSVSGDRGGSSQAGQNPLTTTLTMTKSRTSPEWTRKSDRSRSLKRRTMGMPRTSPGYLTGPRSSWWPEIGKPRPRTSRAC
jgi:hypothetical protein